MKQCFVGINIQWPISSRILDGTKTIETRTYPIPLKYIGKDLLIIETPGKEGKFKARIVGLVRFSGSFKYSSREHFAADHGRHLVSRDSPWFWKGKAKWGWEIVSVKRFPHSKP